MTNTNLLTKIENLLTLASDPRTPIHEAEAASAAADRLMTKYAIDEGMLKFESGNPSEVTHEIILLTGPYPAVRKTLLNIVALRNRCMLIGNGKNRCDLIGTVERIAQVKRTFASLEIQMANVAAAARPDHAPWGKPMTGAAVVSWRTNFQKGWVMEVNSRLKEQALNAEAEATVEHGSGVGLMLQSDDARIKAMTKELYPRLVSGKSSGASSYGYGAGKSAGGSADIGNRQIGGRMAIGAGQ